MSWNAFFASGKCRDAISITLSAIDKTAPDGRIFISAMLIKNLIYSRICTLLTLSIQVRF